MTDPNDSITVTRNELEREIMAWLHGEAPLFWNREFFTLFNRNAAGKALIDTLFTNAKAREEGETGVKP